jgi:TolB-like protein/Tfp pilus assembly protein PilF
VLPFANLSPDEANEYFASGLHDEVLTQLQHVAGLRVISRSSVMEYAEYRPNVRDIARNLRVTHLVEAGVQRIGNRLRVNVMLIDGRVDENVWGERYDRELDDAFAVQSDIAQKVAQALAIALTFEERRAISLEPTTDPAAYRLYVRGREYSRRPGYRQEDFAAAQRALERAIEIDPEFALAHAELSNLHGRMYWEAFDTSPERLEAQQAEAEEALRLQPSLPQAHVALGWVYYVRGEFRRALAEYETALDGLPNDAEVVARIGYARRRLGDWEGVFDAFRQATQLDPLNPNLFYDLGGHSFAATRRYAQAAAAYDTALMLAPDLYDAGIKKGQTYVHWEGNLDSLRAVIARIPAEVHLPEVDQARAELALWERDGSALLRLARQIPAPAVETQLVHMPKALYAAWGHRLVGDGDAANAAFDSARVGLEPLAQARPADQRFETPLAYAYAGLGMVDEAVRSAERITQSPQRSGTSPADPRSDQAVARIYAQVGLAARAVPHLERLLTSESPTSVRTLQLDPLLDPIRGDPAFGQLLERYAEVGAQTSREGERP